MESYSIHQLNKDVSRWPIAILILVVGVFALLFWTFKLRPEHLNAQRQRARIESLAYQVLEIRRQALKNDRGPASESHFEGAGRVGTDSDGKPYFYDLNDENQSWVVRIWSEKDPQDPTEVRIQKDQL